ncbi:MAG TPA: hypothetical protein VIM66_04375 [Candidatus Limnocylindria bacterium]|jgi:hypothetical protein
MNDQDLERELRSQRSPREDGYTPARLPMNLDDGTPSGARRSMVPRAALVAVAALAGALAVAVVTGILSGPRPDVGSDGSPSAQATASVPGDCGPSDVAFSAEPWGGAAGSRGTVVTVKLAAAHDACTLGKGLAAQVADANGSVLVTTGASAPGGSVALADGASFTIGISWSNWCAAAPAAPVTLALKMSGWESFVPVAVPTGETDPVPPCMGSGQPSVLSWTGLEPQQ